MHVKGQHPRPFLRVIYFKDDILEYQIQIPKQKGQRFPYVNTLSYPRRLFFQTTAFSDQIRLQILLAGCYEINFRCATNT
jgi:hypothetical protein